jgi:hypothetical protein
MDDEPIEITEPALRESLSRWFGAPLAVLSRS